jgi:hypothetical protein
MKKRDVIELMENALKEADELYNAVGNGEISQKRAGELFFKRTGFMTIQALSKGLIALKEEK